MPTRGRTRNSASSTQTFSQQSKEQFQTKLDGSAPSGANDRIRSRSVRRCTTAPKRAGGRRIVVGISVLSAKWIREVRMIQNIEELSPELGAEAVRELPILHHREIPVAEARI